MPAPLRQDITTTGIVKLCGRAGHSAYNTPQVQITGTWVGELFFMVDNLPAGAIVAGTEATALTASPYYVQGDYTTQYPATIPIQANGIYELRIGGMPLWLNVSRLVSGTVTVTTIPDAVGTAAPTQIYLSNGIIIDSIPPEYDETFEIVQAWEDAGNTAGTILP